MKTLPTVIPGALLLLDPFVALAQQAQESIAAQQAPCGGQGAWHMGLGAWGFWWIFPLFMFLMMVACIVHALRGHGSNAGSRCCGPAGPGGPSEGRPADAPKLESEPLATGRDAQEIAISGGSKS